MMWLRCCESASSEAAPYDFYPNTWPRGSGFRAICRLAFWDITFTFPLRTSKDYCLFIILQGGLQGDGLLGTCRARKHFLFSVCVFCVFIDLLVELRLFISLNVSNYSR